VLVFRTRFQQLTGPLMAKSVEDTLFFRQHMALALNEVGSEPLPRPYALSAFHEEMQTRRERQPDALSTTSTHDTKRGKIPARGCIPSPKRPKSGRSALFAGAR
jgi:(1->4)-alpha-D-glucan 1-alpha-D-glucosylmutase